MAEPYRRRIRVVRRSGPRLGNPRPGILDGGEDAPLSPRGRFEFRAAVTAIVVLGFLAMLVAEIARH